MDFLSGSDVVSVPILVLFGFFLFSFFHFCLTTILQLGVAYKTNVSDNQVNYAEL